MVASDSPTRVRNRVAIWLSVLRTSSFRAACACSSARMSPVAQLVARSPRTVLTAQRRNRSLEHRRAAGPHAHALRDVGSQSRIRRLVHQRQRSSDAFVGDEAEERRLLELHRESLSQRVVEHRIAGRVGELGEHDRVLVGERRRPRREDVTRPRGLPLPRPRQRRDASAFARRPGTSRPPAVAVPGSGFRRSRSVRRSAAC